MKPKPPRSILSVVFGDKEITCAQIASGSPEARVVRSWAFALPQGMSLEIPDQVGAAFAAELKAQSIPALPVVLGLPAQWVLSRDVDCPPVEAADLRDVVSLQIEQAFASNAQDLVFDFTETAGKHGKQCVMIAAAPRKRVEQVKQFSLAANLRIVGITTPALSMPLPESQGVAAILSGSTASIVTHDEGRCTRIATCENESQAIVRTLTMQAGGSEHQSIALYADTEQDNAALETLLTERLGNCSVHAYHPAKAMGIGWISQRNTRINFANSRLTPKPVRSLSSPMKWGLRAAILLLLVTLGVGYFWFSANCRLDELQAEYDEIHSDAHRVHIMQRDTRTASGWFDKRPPILECLLELTHTFPMQGRIWVEELTLDDRMQGSLNCKAEDRNTMLAYVEAMKASPYLSEVHLHDSSVTGRENTLVDFEITFSFEPKSDGEQS